jgi:integrase
MGVFAMKAINPTVTEHQYPPAKDGTQTKYYLTKCRVSVCEEAPTGVYQKKHSTQAAAEQDRFRLIRLFGGGTLSKEEFRDAEAAIYRLKGSNGPAKGSSLCEAVDFYIANFKGADCSPLVKDAMDKFEGLKFRTLRPDSKEEYSRYFKPFKKRFGELTLGQLTPDLVSNFIDAHPSPKSCYKILHSFLGYCSGSTKKLKNPEPWLDRNLADFYVLNTSDEDDAEIAILSVDEVLNCLVVAMAVGSDLLGDLPFWVWCLYTGMRPMEAKRFWTKEGLGWTQVHLEAGEINVPSGVSKVRRPRPIVIRPNLRAWLLLFKELDVKMYPTKHRLLFREIRSSVLSEEKCKVRDLLRHTYISNRVHAFDKSFATTSVEAGNSERICKDFYFRMIADPMAVEAFWAIRPETFGFVTPGYGFSEEVGTLIQE